MTSMKTTLYDKYANNVLWTSMQTHVEGQVCKQCFTDTLMLKDKYDKNVLRIHPVKHTHDKYANNVEGQVCKQHFTDTTR